MELLCFKRNIKQRECFIYFYFETFMTHKHILRKIINYCRSIGGAKYINFYFMKLCILCNYVYNYRFGL